MTNCWPTCSPTFWNATRPTTSVAPPGGNTMTTRTGFEGYCCAHTMPLANRIKPTHVFMNRMAAMPLLLVEFISDDSWQLLTPCASQLVETSARRLHDTFISVVLGLEHPREIVDRHVHRVE